MTLVCIKLALLCFGVAYVPLFGGQTPPAMESMNMEILETPQSLYKIVQVGEPVLRKMARPLTKSEILSDEIQCLIEEMKMTMRAATGVGLAAPQIGLPIQLIVIEDMCHSYLTEEQLLERERGQVPFHVIINPQMSVDGKETVDFFEGCLSIQGYVGMVPRAKSVHVECLNERAEPVIIDAKGWYARILQHEIDHLNATLYIDRASLPTFMTEENYKRLWKDSSIEDIKNSFING